MSANIHEIRACFGAIEDKIETAIQNNYNVIFRGERGVGKTHMVMAAADRHKLVMKYFSASTLDPFADLVGVPVPRGEEIKYLRSSDINDAQFMFFDEINRAHKKVTNAVLEIIQFKTINGDKFKDLRMVWASMNPDNDEHYHTEDLDIALEDRFHIQIDVPYTVNPNYFDKKFGAEISESVFNWWEDLSSELKAVLSPRRLDFMVEGHLSGIDMEVFVPFDGAIPLADLKNILNTYNPVVNFNDILNDQQTYIDIVKSARVNDETFINAMKIILSLTDDMIPQISEVIMNIPDEYFYKMFKDIDEMRYQRIRQDIYDIRGAEAVIEFEKRYQGTI